MVEFLGGSRLVVDRPIRLQESKIRRESDSIFLVNGHIMTPECHPDTVDLLARFQEGDPDATAELIGHLSREMRFIAGRLMRKERPGHTLQPTALVNEAYLRLVGSKRTNWKGRAHFLAAAACAMRRILVEHARKKNAQKRRGERTPVTLVRLGEDDLLTDIDILALHECLEKLKRVKSRDARVIDLLYFGDLTTDEAAAVLEVSPRAIKYRKRLAIAWLRRELEV